MMSVKICPIVFCSVLEFGPDIPHALVARRSGSAPGVSMKILKTRGGVHNGVPSSRVAWYEWYV